MKAEELIRFDWVHLADDNTPRQVDWIRSGEVGLFWNKTVTPPYLEPIPLTLEILEKNGFVKFIAGQYLLPAGNNEWVVTIVPNLASAPNSNGTMLIAIKNIYTDAKIAITYVHQLQHALRLCGIDKTIEL